MTSDNFIYPNEKLKLWNGRQCNWDYTRPVEQEHVKELINIACSAPSKNNINFIEIQVFENSLDTQKVITEKAKGAEGETIKTSTEAPLTFFMGLRKSPKKWMEKYYPKDYLEMLNRSQGNDSSFYAEYNKFCYMTGAFIAGALSKKANDFGYKTGINCCFIPKTKLFNSESSVFLSVGIGHPFYQKHALRGLPNHVKDRGQGPYRKKYHPVFSHIKDNVLVTSTNGTPL